MLVSIIIPCYNVENYIEECLNSCVNQTYENIEIICIDNNSSDLTLVKLYDFKKKHTNIIILSESKLGANAARNKGILLSKGDWIQFLDADDLLEPNKIKHQINLLHKCNFQTSFIAGASKKCDLKNDITFDINLEENKFIGPFIGKSGNTCSNLWNKKTLLQVNSWDESIASSQESELMLRIILNNGDYILDNTPLTIIRERRSGRISDRNPIEKWHQYISVRILFLQKLKLIFPIEYKKYKSIYIWFLLISIFTLMKFDKLSGIKLFNLHIKNNLKLSKRLGFNNIKIILIKILGIKLYCNLILKNNLFK